MFTPCRARSSCRLDDDDGQCDLSQGRTSRTYGGGPDPTDPRSVFAEAKRLAELLCALGKRVPRFYLP